MIQIPKFKDHHYLLPALAPIAMISAWGLALFPIGIISAVFFVQRTMKDPVVLFLIFCLTTFLCMEIGRTSINGDVSEAQNLYNVLKEKNVAPDQILMYKTGLEWRLMLSFYYDRLLNPIVKQDLGLETKVRAIVTRPGFEEDVTKVYGPSKESRLIANHRGKHQKDVVVIFSQPITPGS